MSANQITIPAQLLPVDGRFGAGPSKVFPASVQALADSGPAVLGTSHRQAPVKQLVGCVKERLAEFYSLPDDYEVVMGVGGSNAFWDVAAFSLIERRQQNVVGGEFGAKFAKCATTPFLAEPDVISTEPGTLALPRAVAGIDSYAWAHNETSTGVMAPVVRVDGTEADALMIVDGTSAAGGLELDVSQTDVYYFAPQKSFASDGGLWFALCSPAALERAERIKSSGRWIPPFLDFVTAAENSRKAQTYNTPAVATYFLMNEQLGWMLDNGGMEFAAARCRASAQTLYSWAEASEVAAPFVQQPDARSNVIGTIDFVEDIDAATIASVLRAHGVVDTEPYRKLGRNQLRIGMYPAVDPDDVAALTRCIDYVIANLA